MGRIQVTHFSDPGCPWAYSAGPAFAALRWRFGDQLEWRHVMIGLAEDPTRYVRRGYTPEHVARNYRRFRERGMPFATEPRERVPATARACRAVIATRLYTPALEWAAFRALQFGWFTSSLVLDEDDAIRTALARVEGLDADAIAGAIDDPDVLAAYAADREEARTAAGGPTEAQGRAANTDGAVRFTAPSLVFAAPDGRSLEAGGFQPLEAYDVCLANLDPTLARRDAPDDVAELLDAFPHGLTTREVAACLAPNNEAPDDGAAEDLLIAAVASSAAERRGLGNDALWLPARRAAARLAA